MSKLIGPDFIALQVPDPEASARFYEDMLGLTRAPAGPPGAVVFQTTPTRCTPSCRMPAWRSECRSRMARSDASSDSPIPMAIPSPRIPFEEQADRRQAQGEIVCMPLPALRANSVEW